MKKLFLTTVAFLSVVALALPVFAEYTGTMVPGASGHPFYAEQADDFYIFDNYVGYWGPNGSRDWATPLCTPPGLPKVGVYQKGSNNQYEKTKSAAFSFNARGAVYSWTGRYTSGETIGDVYIPNGGTVFVRSNLWVGNIGLGEARLSSVRWYPR